MAQTDAFKKYLDAGMAFTQLTRKKAEQVVKDLVAAGELQRGQAKSAIDDLVERSRANAELLSEQVRKEVDSQLSNLGLRKSDTPSDKTAAKPKDEPAKTEDAKKEPAKKPPARKAPAKAAKKASGSAAPVGADLPSKKAAGSEGGGNKPGSANKAPAKAAKKAGGDAAPVGADLPAKKVAKATKKQG